MYFLFTTRIVKINIRATEKFAPRTANETSIRVSGPFASERQAQRAALAALATHTCLDAKIFSAEQVIARHAKGSSIGHYEWGALDEAKRLIPAQPTQPA